MLEKLSEIYARVNQLGLILVVLLGIALLVWSIIRNRQGRPCVYYRISDRELGSQLLISGFLIAMITHFLLTRDFWLALLFVLATVG
ncbi:MAG: hypothetical protein WB755_20995, partial [Terriglobales bacterium]